MACHKKGPFGTVSSSDDEEDKSIKDQFSRSRRRWRRNKVYWFNLSQIIDLWFMVALLWHVIVAPFFAYLLIPLIIYQSSKVNWCCLKRINLSWKWVSIILMHKVGQKLSLNPWKYLCLSIIYHIDNLDFSVNIFSRPSLRNHIL